MADDARTLVADAMRAFGLDSLADWIMQNVVEGTDAATVYLRLRETPQYKQRFPAMEELQRQARAGGRGYTEADYIALENSYREVLSTSGLPARLWDSSDDFAALMKGQVSPSEVQQRVDAAKEAVLSTDPNTRAQLLRLYGIDTQALMGYALVPDRGADEIRRTATTAIMAGMGAAAGLGSSLSREQWERYSGEMIQSQAGFGEIRSAIESAYAISDTQSRLASLEGERFTESDALDITVMKDAGKSLASEQRARREKARFSATSGISSGSLAGRSGL